MELFLIRHGQSANNALADVSQRDKDPPLTELGHRQAGRLAAFLAAGGHLSQGERQEDRPVLDRVYCSPMLRAMQTAESVGRALGLPVEVWVDIHEVGGIYLDHGPERGTVGYPGQTRSEMAARFPDFALPDAVTEQGWWKGGMESFHAGQGRAIGVATALRERAGSAERIALISHGGFGSCLLQALGRQLPADGFYYEHLVHVQKAADLLQQPLLADGVYYEHGNTGISRVRLISDGSSIFIYLNRLEHLTVELIS